jgi:predicted nucleotidyltransferase
MNLADKWQELEDKLNEVFEKVLSVPSNIKFGSDMEELAQLMSDMDILVHNASIGDETVQGDSE